MSKVEEIICGRCPQKQHCDYIKIGRVSKCTYAGYFSEGYEQAVKDFMAKAEKWFESEFRLNDAPYKEMLIRRFKQAMRE